MKDNKLTKFFLWIALVWFYFALNIVFGVIIESLKIKNNLYLSIIGIVCEIVITGIIVFLYRKDFKNKFKELKTKEGNEKIKSSIKIWLIGLIVMVLLNTALSFIITDIAQNESANRTIILESTIYAIISMVILTPICEEVIFRLSTSKIFDNKYLYIIFSGLIFGFAHVMGSTGLQALYILPYTALGISFSYIYQKSQNILCSILMHTIHNMACIILIFCL